MDKAIEIVSVQLDDGREVKPVGRNCRAPLAYSYAGGPLPVSVRTADGKRHTIPQAVKDNMTVGTMRAIIADRADRTRRNPRRTASSSAQAPTPKARPASVRRSPGGRTSTSSAGSAQRKSPSPPWLQMVKVLAEAKEFRSARAALSHPSESLRLIDAVAVTVNWGAIGLERYQERAAYAARLVENNRMLAMIYSAAVCDAGTEYFSSMKPATKEVFGAIRSKLRSGETSVFKVASQMPLDRLGALNSSLSDLADRGELGSSMKLIRSGVAAAFHTKNARESRGRVRSSGNGARAL